MTSLLADAPDWAGVCVAIIAGIVAFASYQQAASNNTMNHIHGLFRDYLRLRYEYSHSLTTAGGTDRERLEQQMVSFKLYVCEDIFAWCERERAKISSLFYPPYRTKARLRRRDLLEAWRTTLLFHVSREWAATHHNLVSNARCYTVQFLELVSEGSHVDSTFREWVAVQRQNVARGLPRTDFPNLPPPSPEDMAVIKPAATPALA